MRQKTRGNIDPAQALGIFGVMILIVSGVTMFAFSHMEIGQSADFGAVDFSETDSGEIQISVIESGSVTHFNVETASGETHTLNGSSGASIIVDAEQVTVYGVNSDGEQTQVDSFSR